MAARKLKDLMHPKVQGRKTSKRKGYELPDNYLPKPPKGHALLNLTKNDIDLIFDMIAIDEVMVQPFLKMLNAPNQNLRRAHVAALRVKLEQILRA